MKKLLHYFLGTLLFCQFSVYAQPAQQECEQEFTVTTDLYDCGHLGDCGLSPDFWEQTKALAVMKKHAETIACQIEMKDIFFVEGEIPDQTYYVLWYGDGCTGGNGTNSYFVSELQSGAMHDYFVLNNKAFGKEFDKINYRFIEYIRQICTNRFEIETREFAESDHAHSPSQRYLYLFEREKVKSKNGNYDYWSDWKITNKEKVPY